MASITAEEYVPPPEALPEDTLVRVRCLEEKVEERSTRDGSNTWQSLSLKFEILATPEGYEHAVGDWVYGDVSFKLTDHPDNPLRLWTEALLGIEVGRGFDLDTEHFVGRECKAVLGTYFSKKYKVNKNKVVGLLPMGPLAKATASAPSPNLASGAPALSDENLPF